MPVLVVEQPSSHTSSELGNNACRVLPLADDVKGVKFNLSAFHAPTPMVSINMVVPFLDQTAILKPR
ncbi:hypothetical protein D3C87_1634650 [compost metagenome]